MEIEIVDGKAQVTKTQTIEEVTIYTKEEIEHEIEALQNEIDKLETKKSIQQQILNAFPR